MRDSFTLRKIALALACTLAAGSAFGQDHGYALECTATETGQKHLLSFLEDGKNKRVRFLQTATGTMWDTHEWGYGTLLISSFSMPSGETEPSLLSTFEITLDTLSGKLTEASKDNKVTALQCAKWSPRTRNK